jgi:hypothetical protein
MFLVPRHAFVLDDARMRESLQHLDFTHDVPHFGLLHTLKPNPLDGCHLAGTEIEAAVDRAKLPAADTVAHLLPVNFLPRSHSHIRSSAHLFR